MRQFLLTVGLLALIPHSATAQWVWSTETGWVNSRYIGTNNAQTLIARARQMEKGNQHQDASKAFEKIAKQYPKSKHAREALYSAAESKFKQGKHYEANKLYEEYLDKYQKDHQHKHITKRRYEIGRALVRGEKRKLMGLKLLSDENDGEQILLEIINDYPFDKNVELSADDVADDAMFVLGNYYYRQKRFEEAEAMYERLRDKFPKSEWAPASLYKIALAQKAQNAGSSYDASGLVKARTTLKKYRKEVPEGTEVKKAAGAIRAVDETLARKTLKTALFYYRRHKFRAAHMYLKRVIHKHPQSKAAAEAAAHLKKIK